MLTTYFMIMTADDLRIYSLPIGFVYVNPGPWARNFATCHRSLLVTEGEIQFARVRAWSTVCPRPGGTYPGGKVTISHILVRCNPAALSGVTSPNDTVQF